MTKAASALWYSRFVHPDLEKLIRLQALDTRAADARKAQVIIPEQQRALDATIEEARAGIAASKERLAATQEVRRAVEKDLTAMQARLSRYKDQLMEVKTNREYHAMQHEIETAEHEVKRFEDAVLGRMLEADEAIAAIKAAEAALEETERHVAAERARLDGELKAAGRTIEEAARDRTALLAEIPPAAAALYEQVARARKGTAIAEARDGLCAECHVRLRPQKFAEVRRNAGVIQCDSCLRILYYLDPQAAIGA